MNQDAPDAVVEEKDNVEDAEPPSLPQQGPAASSAAGKMEQNLKEDARPSPTTPTEHYDAAIVYAEQDADLAIDIMDHLNKVVLDDRKNPKVCLYGDLKGTESETEAGGKITQVCTLVLVLATEQFHNSPVALLIKDEVIGNTRLDKKCPEVLKHCVRPVYVEKERTYGAPAGLSSIDAINWYNKDSRSFQRYIKNLFNKYTEYRKQREESTSNSSFNEDNLQPSAVGTRNISNGRTISENQSPRDQGENSGNQPPVIMPEQAATRQGLNVDDPELTVRDTPNSFQNSPHLKQDCRPKSTNLDIKDVTDGTAGTANTSSSVDGGMGNKHFGPLHQTYDPRPQIKNMDTTGVTDGTVGTANTASFVDGGMGHTTTGNIASNAEMSFGQNIVHGDQNIFGSFFNIHPSGNSETTAGENDNSPVTVEPEDWFESVPAVRKVEQVTDKDLSRMVEGLADGWEFIALELNFKKVQIDKEKMSTTSPSMQMLNVFVKWRQKEGHKATFKAFVNALKSCDNRCTIDWDLIKDVVLNRQ